MHRLTSQTSANALTFDVVDDLGYALAQGAESINSITELYRATRIGPLVEFFHIASSNNQALNDRNLPGVELNDYRGLYSAFLKIGADIPCFPSDQMGMLRLGRSLESGIGSWNLFTMRALTAAKSAGFDPDVARGLNGAMNEMYDNVFEHSGAADTGIVAFQAGEEEFEFVVSDCGIGVLQSLRQNTEYHHLRTHREALQTAVAPGESRYGRASGHGTGFQQLMVGLANLQGTLRFRSGDYSLTMQQHTSGSITQQADQGPSFGGFCISVHCRAAK